MKQKEISFSLDVDLMAALTNAAVERDRIKDMLRFAEAALHRKKDELTKYMKKVSDQKAMLTHLQEICESRKTKPVKWRTSVKIGYHLLHDPNHEVKVYEATDLIGGVVDAFNKLNDDMGYCPLVIDWIEEVE